MHGWWEIHHIRDVTFVLITITKIFNETLEYYLHSAFETSRRFKYKTWCDNLNPDKQYEIWKLYFGLISNEQVNGIKYTQYR